MPELNPEIAFKIPPFQDYLSDYPHFQPQLRAIFNQEMEFIEQGKDLVFRQEVVEFAQHYDIPDILGNWRLPSREPQEMIVAMGNAGGLARSMENNLQGGWTSRLFHDPLNWVIKDIIQREDQRNLKPFNQLLEEIISLNPALNQLKIDRQNTRQLYIATSAIIYQNNIDDIEFYTLEKKYSREETQKRRDLEKLVNIPWNPSSRTVDKIRTAFGLDRMSPRELIKEASRIIFEPQKKPSLPKDVVQRLEQVVKERLEWI